MGCKACGVEGFGCFDLAEGSLAEILFKFKIVLFLHKVGYGERGLRSLAALELCFVYLVKVFLIAANLKFAIDDQLVICLNVSRNIVLRIIADGSIRPNARCRFLRRVHTSISWREAQKIRDFSLNSLIVLTLKTSSLFRAKNYFSTMFRQSIRLGLLLDFRWKSGFKAQICSMGSENLLRQHMFLRQKEN